MNTFLVAASIQLTAFGITTETHQSNQGSRVQTSTPTTSKIVGSTVGSPVQHSTVVSQLPTMSLHQIEHNIIAKTNAQRARYGKAPLTIDESLMHSARSHAQWMARNRVMQHTRANVGENVAMGQNSSTQAIQDWMNSPGHRANILSNQYSRIGVAAYRGNDGQVYWCQQFLR